MPSYDSFMCPNCEHHFRVIWPEPLPSHHHKCSEIKMKCPDCGEVTELYDFLIDKVLQAPEPGIPSIEVCLFLPVTRTPTLTPEVITGIRSGHAGRRDTGECIGRGNNRRSSLPHCNNLATRYRRVAGDTFCCA